MQGEVKVSGWLWWLFDSQTFGSLVIISQSAKQNMEIVNTIELLIIYLFI
jgi:hypothetical protein